MSASTMMLLSASLSEESQLFLKRIAEHYITNQKVNLEQAEVISLGILAPWLKCHSDQVTYIEIYSKQQLRNLTITDWIKS